MKWYYGVVVGEEKKRGDTVVQRIISSVVEYDLCCPAQKNRVNLKLLVMLGRIRAVREA